MGDMPTSIVICPFVSCYAHFKEVYAHFGREYAHFKEVYAHIKRGYAHFKEVYAHFRRGYAHFKEMLPTSKELCPFTCPHKEGLSPVERFMRRFLIRHIMDTYIFMHSVYNTV
jgi:hypothetical protein